MPIASPSPRLCSPMPTATSVASASAADGSLARSEPPREQRQEQVGRRRRRGARARPRRARSAAPPAASNASASASKARNVSSPAVSAMNAASHCGLARRSDGSQASPSATGTTPTRKPITRVAEESLRRCLRRLDRGRDLLRRLDPRRARHADAERLAVDPVEGDDDRRRAEPPDRPVAVERVRDDRVVDGDRRDRDVLALRVRDLDLDLAGPELDAADVELVARRRVLPDEVEQRVAGGDEDRDRADERDDRQQRPEPPVRAAQPRRERA